MGEWVRSALDIVLIALVAGGLVQASRLIRHLVTLRAGRAEMEGFVREFNTAVIRAEAGIKALRQAARDSGDDLEKLINKSGMARDELQFIVESADQLAERLTQAASSAVRAEPKPRIEIAPEAPPAAEAPKLASVTPMAPRKAEPISAPSRAEKELLQALQKMS
ncbi:MAG: DUF6468 domain-containing protein [Alphaproteobacteria bacterium]|nr:DUF6468 domain-containing protein [Alphaproteobacteria bacterium]